MIIDLGQRHLAGVDCLCQFCPIKQIAGLFMIKARSRCLCGAVSSSPVRQYEPVECPGFL